MYRQTRDGAERSEECWEQRGEVGVHLLLRRSRSHESGHGWGGEKTTAVTETSTFEWHFDRSEEPSKENERGPQAVDRHEERQSSAIA